MNLVRINKHIASTSLYSRREADKLIAEGKVTLNGEIVKDQGIKVDIDNDVVAVNGDFIEEAVHEVLKFYKPRGVLTAYGEGRGKETLDEFDIFSKRKLPYSGRLDYESEGLLIFTNDGELIQHLQKPEFKVEKEYIVTVDRLLSDEELVEFSGGLETSKGDFMPCKITPNSQRSYSVIIKEGKKRQIRLMFGYFGVTVHRLVRIRIGNVLLENMKPGEHKYLTDKELKELYKCTGLR